MRSSSISDVLGSKYEPTIKARVITTWHVCSKQVQNIKLFDTQRVLYFGRNSQRAFSLYFMRSKFCKLSHKTNSLILQPTGLSPWAPAASMKLDAPRLNHSRIHRNLLLFCQFWSLSGERSGGIILIMHYYHCKTPW
jgi:hypothetical protein